jgi:hypothetical protein
MVNAGGDLRVFGDRTETVLLRRGTEFHPRELENAALAVSDLDATERPEEHQGYYSRVDVGRVSPGFTQRYAAVLAPEATIADALTKCVLLCPSDITARILLEFEAQSV